MAHDHIERLHRHDETSHTEHGLMYLAEGWAQMEHGGPVRAEAGSITIVPAGVPHRPLDGRNMDSWLTGFCATCLSLDESQILMSPFRRVRQGALPVISIPKGRRRRVIRLYKEIAEEAERAAPESRELARCSLLLLLGEVRRAMPGLKTDAPERSLVSEALQFIQRRCLDSISLKDVAAAVHRTPAHVAAEVKKSTGYAVGEWIRAGRVAEAAARLAHTDDSIDQVARDVGWQDQTHFIRQFRKAYGATPAAWRREHRAQHAR